jgi:HK97 family phage portal protein
MMSRNGTLYATVSLLANSTAQVNWRLFRHSDGRGRISSPDPRREVTNHAALDLWNRPNDFMYRQLFVETFQQHIELTGKAFWIMTPSAAGPLDMWPVMPHRMVAVPDQKSFLAGWVYLGPNGEQVPFNRTEVIWLRQPHPYDPYDGLGAVEAMMSDIESAHFISDWNRAFFKNSAQPGGFVTIPDRVSDEQFEEITTRWAEQHQGVQRAHRVAFLESGATWQPGGYSMKDMQFTELRQDTRDTTYEGFGVSKGMLGVVDDVNRANIEGSEYIYAKYRMVPRLERIKGALNTQLLPLFGATGQGVEFDYDNPVPEDWQADAATLKEQAKAALELVEAGYEPADVLKTIGMPDMRWVGPPALLTLPKAQPGMEDDNSGEDN